MKEVPESSVILIVDDNPTNLKILAETLAQAGFEVAIAPNGESAIEQAHYDPPALILLDVMMPKLDGFETCQRLKNCCKTQDIPIIFMTALADLESKVQGLNSGAVDYITKPFQVEEVLARVRLHLRLQSLNQQLAVQATQLQQFNQALEQRVAERTAALSEALTNLKKTQLQLVQTEKMSVLGNLVAGVAHEINNPLGCIAGNLEPIQQYFQDLFQLVKLYEQHNVQPDAEIIAHIKAIELDYISSDFDGLINTMNLSVARIYDISRSLCTFSRTDKNCKIPFNIHECVKSTILILKHRLKADETRPAIEIMTDYDQRLPEIDCFPGQLKQVLINLIANAIDAVEEANRDRSYDEIEANPNQIILRTGLLNSNQIKIEIIDNGVGMTSAIRSQIFDYLFTTKGVGKGTGLGLAIARQIVEETHHGRIEVASEPGKGTTFTILLPVRG